MSLQTPSPQASAHAPIHANPLQLASATIKAVDQLGVTTADEIEKTADEIMRGATEIMSKLRELADAIRQHTEVASGHVESFCSKATSVFEGIVELQEKLRLNSHKTGAEGERLARPAEILEGDAGALDAPLNANPSDQASERIASAVAAALGEPTRSEDNPNALRRAARRRVGA